MDGINGVASNNNPDRASQRATIEQRNLKENTGAKINNRADEGNADRVKRSKERRLETEEQIRSSREPGQGTDSVKINAANDTKIGTLIDQTM